MNIGAGKFPRWQVIYWRRWIGIGLTHWTGDIARIFRISIRLAFWEVRIWRKDIPYAVKERQIAEGN